MIAPHISKEWEIPAGLTASLSSSMINREVIYRLQFTSNGEVHAIVMHQY